MIENEPKIIKGGSQNKQKRRRIKKYVRKLKEDYLPRLKKYREQMATFGDRNSYAKNKVCRFSELQKRMPNCSRRMLSLQLSELEKDKIIEKKIYPVIPPKTEYKLTRFGQTLTPLIIEMEKWGRTYNTINLEEN